MVDMAHWKARVEFLLSVIGLLFLSLTVEALQGGRSVRASISGGRGRPWGIFLVSTKLDIFAIRQCKLHRATCRRFDAMPACDRRTDGQTEGETDGITVVSTALPMRALRRPVKITFDYKDCRFMWYKNIAGRLFRLLTKHACDRQTNGHRRTE